MKHKYDIAFSFLAEDENKVLELYELLRDRLECFVYSKRQEELISEDGIEKFTDVFSKDARIVVLLYREKYGSTRWTRIEETAIKGRGFNNTFSFLVMIPIDKNLNTPKWYPEYMIWSNLQSIGLEETAHLIINKVKTSGGEIKGNPIDAKAERIKRTSDFKSKLNRYLMSKKVFEDASHEFVKIIRKTQELKNKIFAEKLQIFNNEFEEINLYEVRIPKFRLQYVISSEYKGQCRYAKLMVNYFEIRPFEDQFETSRVVRGKSFNYEYSRDINWNIVWKSLKDKREYSYIELSEKHFYMLLDYYEKDLNIEKDTSSDWA